MQKKKKLHDQNIRPNLSFLCSPELDIFPDNPSAFYPTIITLPFSEIQVEQLKYQTYGFIQLNKLNSITPSIFQKIIDPYPEPLQPLPLLRRLYEHIPWHFRNLSHYDLWLELLSYSSNLKNISLVPNATSYEIKKESFIPDLDYRQLQSFSPALGVELVQDFVSLESNKESKLLRFHHSTLFKFQKKVREDILLNALYPTTNHHIETLFQDKEIFFLQRLSCPLNSTNLGFKTHLQKNCKHALRVELNTIFEHLINFRYRHSHTRAHFHQLGHNSIAILSKCLLEVGSQQKQTNDVEGAHNSKTKSLIRIKYHSTYLADFLELYLLASSFQKKYKTSLNLSFSIFEDIRKLKYPNSLFSTSFILPLPKSKRFFESRSSNFFTGVLTEFQLDGLNWMISLYNYGLNGILADETGAGKKAQIIALIAFLTERMPGNAPFLLLAPQVFIKQWGLEFKKWAPSLKILILEYNPSICLETAFQNLKDDFHVLLTSIDFGLKQLSFFSLHKWLYMIIDVGNKNIQPLLPTLCALTENLTSCSKILISHSVLPWKLEELFCLSSFLLNGTLSTIFPDREIILPSYTSFLNQVATLNKQGKCLLLETLKNIVKLFFLRRSRRDFSANAVRLLERIIVVPLSCFTCNNFDALIKVSTPPLQALVNTGKINFLSQYELFWIEFLKFIVSNNTRFFTLWCSNSNKTVLPNCRKFELLDRVLPQLLALNRRIILLLRTTEAIDFLCLFLKYRNYMPIQLDLTKDPNTLKNFKYLNSPFSPYNIILTLDSAFINFTCIPYVDTFIFMELESENGIWNYHHDPYQALATCTPTTHRSRSLYILKLFLVSNDQENFLSHAATAMVGQKKLQMAKKFKDATTNDDIRYFMRRHSIKERSNECGIDLTDGQLVQILAKDHDEVGFLEKIMKRAKFLKSRFSCVQFSSHFASSKCSTTSDLVVKSKSNDDQGSLHHFQKMQPFSPFELLRYFNIQSKQNQFDRDKALSIFYSTDWICGLKRKYSFLNTSFLKKKKKPKKKKLR